MISIENRCPEIRDQRWFTEFEALQWIISNREKIENAYVELQDILPGKCPITNDWVLLLEAFRPLRRYVSLVERDICPISKVYLYFKEMQDNIKKLSNSNRFAVDLYSIIEERWHSTSDINLFMLAHFIRPDTYKSFQNSYHYLMQKFPTGGLSEDKKKHLLSLQEQLDTAVQSTIKYGNAMGYHFDGEEETINYVLTLAKLPFARRNEYFWEGIGITSGQMVVLALNDGIHINGSIATKLCEFYVRLTSLPSSEAFCERVFAQKSV